MAINPTVKSDSFLPNHGSNSYGAWCGGCQGPSDHDAGCGAFQVSGRLDDGGRHGVRKLLSFLASFERTVVQIVASKLSIMTGQAICSWFKHKR